ncbi:MAG: caspase family protein [Saprospiraceae bacterium]|nr:caspase family protein [Saprospiraceae bacterium]
MDKEFLADAYYQYILSAIQAGKEQDAIGKYGEMGEYFSGHAKYHSLKSLVEPVHFETEKSRFFALVIGIDQYGDSKCYNPLNGCVNDANLFTELITSKRKNTDIIFLKNENATSKNIKNCFEELFNKAEPGDTVAVYFSGHAYIRGVNANEYALVVYDSTDISVKEQAHTFIWGDDLHEAMQKIRAVNKFLVVDTHSDTDFMTRVEESGNYTMMFGCDDGEQAYEQQFDGKTHGVFTYALASVVREYTNEDSVPYNLHEQVVKYIKDRNFRQTPKMVGDITPLFFPQKSIQPADLIQIATNDRAPLSESNYYRLSNLHQKAPLLHTLFFPVLKKLGRHLLQKGEFDKAIAAYESYLLNSEEANNELEALIPLVEIYDRFGQYEKATLQLKKWIDTHQGLSEKDPIINLYNKYLNHNNTPQTKYALIIGINKYKKEKALQSAVKDAESWRQYLAEDLHLPKENITLLLDESATRKKILSEFEKHAKLAKEYPVLFFFAGYGAAYTVVEPPITRAIFETDFTSDDTPFIPAILSVDSRQGKIGDIFFKELYDLQIKNESRFLTCILDIGFDEKPGNRGVAAREIHPRGISRAADYLRTADGITQGIGNLTILPGAINPKNLSEKPKLWCIETPDNGIFSKGLLEVLRQNIKTTYRFSHLAKEVRLKKQQIQNYILNPIIIGDPEAVVFGVHNLGQKEIELVKAGPVTNLKTLLEQQIGSNWGDFPDNLVILAIAETILGNYEKAAAMLSTAVADETKESLRLVKANYHLGRVLVENSSPDDKENWSQALNALRAATQVLPDFAPAYYYLGKAIRQVSIIEGRSEAVKAFQKYQESYYPIGYQEEVDQYLDSLDDERLRKRYMSDGMTYLEQNELSSAEQCFQEARLLGENSAFYYMAEVYNRQGDFLRALNSYNQAKMLGVDKEDLAYKMGDMVRLFLKGSDVIQQILDDVQEYQNNPSILKYNDTDVLLDNLSKIQDHLAKLDIGWR